MKRPTASIVAVTTNANYANRELRVLSRLRTLASLFVLGLVIGACGLGFSRDLLAAPASAASAASAKNEVTADEIASRVQAFYDKTKTFRAGFKQTYFIRATGIEKKSNGDVTFAKPGKMSWRYKNNGNRVTSDGHVIRVYEQENKQMFESDMSKSAYPAALSFLVGEGQLQQAFVLKKLDARLMKFEGGFVLEAKPKESTPAYQAMILYVDAATAQVRRVLLVDAQGNRNRFDFLSPTINAKVEPSEFAFVPPSGTQVVRQ
jgi:outer membrane lipoprotein carrier protein